VRDASSKTIKVHAAAETSARNKKLGLWSDNRAVAPWDFRKQGQ